MVGPWSGEESVSKDVRPDAKRPRFGAQSYTRDEILIALLA